MMHHLHSPLVCTTNAARLEAIWRPRLTPRPAAAGGSGARPAPRPLARASWAQWWEQRWARAGVKRAPAAKGGAQPAADRRSRLLDILVAHSALHTPALLASLLMTSTSMQQRIARVVHRRLDLSVTGLRADTLISFSGWLASHGTLLAALDVAAEVPCCCPADTRAACSPLLKALSTVPPGTRLRVSLPDVHPDDVSQLPPGLVGLRLGATSAAASTLRAISRQCPKLQDVRLAYRCDGGRASAALARARGGWSSLPVLELAFVGPGEPAPLPPGARAASVLSMASLEQLAALPRLERVAFTGCVDAMLDEVAALLRASRSLRTLIVPACDSGGVWTRAETSTDGQQAWRDSTADLLAALQQGTRQQP